MDTSLEHEFDLAQLELQSRQLHQHEVRTSGFIFDDDNERRDRKLRRQTESDIQSIIHKWIQKDHKEIHAQLFPWFWALLPFDKAATVKHSLILSHRQKRLGLPGLLNVQYER